MSTPASGVPQPYIRPPLKWAGGKFRIIHRILKLLSNSDRLIEPFVGSGALFLNSTHTSILINDRNSDLINFYKILKRDKEEFIKVCKKYFTAANNAEGVYYDLRDEFNATGDSIKKAALFLYINKHGYNGLCRYNAAGDCNVPFGRYIKPYFPEHQLRHAVTRLKNAAIKNADFEKIMKAVKAGDVIYCDPPYVPLTKTSNFTAYSAGGFSWEDQERLASLAKKTAKRGVSVVISNHSTPEIIKLYSGAKLSKFSVRRLISCNGGKRETANELLAVFT